MKNDDDTYLASSAGNLVFPKPIKPDDRKDYTEVIIFNMKAGYRRHHGLIELPPPPKKVKIKENCSIRANKRHAKKNASKSMPKSNSKG
ncbi:hypothetical protein [Pantoea stewartii]|uniref:hypothetical protein n=1 Tax=Pantoea stewartii TaxID=66269 RepID=UPI003368F945